MTPAEDARLLLRLVERHLGSLRGTLNPAVFADEDWGFLAQQTLEKALKALLVIHNQEPHPEAIPCNVCSRSSRPAGKVCSWRRNCSSSMISPFWLATTQTPLLSRRNGADCWSCWKTFRLIFSGAFPDSFRRPRAPSPG